MKLTRPELLAYVLVGMVIVAVSVLSGLHVPINEFLTTAGMVALGIGGGATLPRGTSTDTSAAAVVEEPAAVAVPTQRVAAESPVATHAP